MNIKSLKNLSNAFMFTFFAFVLWYMISTNYMILAETPISGGDALMQAVGLFASTIGFVLTGVDNSKRYKLALVLLVAAIAMAVNLVTVAIIQGLGRYYPEDSMRDLLLLGTIFLCLIFISPLCAAIRIKLDPRRSEEAERFEAEGQSAPTPPQP